MANIRAKTNYLFRVFDKSHGKVAVTAIIDNTLQLKCRICQHKYTINRASVKDIACRQCKVNSTTPYTFNKALGGHLQYNLYWQPKQLAVFFNCKPKNLPEFKAVTAEAKLRVMTLDPGTANFGLFVGDLYGNKSGELTKIKALESRMLMHTFSSINNIDMANKVQGLLTEIIEISNKYRPNIVMIERFQSRGKFSSNSNEIINIIIGIIWVSLTKADFMVKILPPSTWKNAVNRVTPLEQLYQQIKQKLLPHQLDTALMAIALWPGLDKSSFHCLRKPKFKRKLLKSLEKSAWQIKMEVL